jgi:hypothetical protein
MIMDDDIEVWRLGGLEVWKFGGLEVVVAKSELVKY